MRSRHLAIGLLLSTFGLVAGSCVKSAYRDVVQSFDTCGSLHACDGQVAGLAGNQSLTTLERNELLSRMCLETKTPRACSAACAAFPEDKERFRARGCTLSGTWCLQGDCAEQFEYAARLARYAQAIEAEEESPKNDPVPLALLRTGMPSSEAWPASVDTEDAVATFSFACRHGVADGCRKQKWIEDPAQATRDCESNPVACEIALARLIHSTDPREILEHASTVCARSDSECDAFIQTIAARGPSSPVPPADIALAAASSCADAKRKTPACTAARLLTPDQAVEACTRSLSACMRSRAVIEKKLRRPLPASCAAGALACSGEVAKMVTDAAPASECKSAPATCRSAQVEAFLAGRASALDGATKAAFGRFFSTLITEQRMPDASVIDCAKLPQGYEPFCEKIRPQMLMRLGKLMDQVAACLPKAERYEAGCGDAVVERTTTTMPNWLSPTGGYVTRYDEKTERRCSQGGYLAPARVEADCNACVTQFGLQGGGLTAPACAAMSRR